MELGRGGEAFNKANERFTIAVSHVFPVCTVITWVAVLTSTTSFSHSFKLRNSPAAALRCASIMHGLSPFVPLVVVLLAYLLWALVNLRRLGAACSKRVWVEAIPAAGQSLSSEPLQDLNQLHKELQAELQSCIAVLDWKQNAVVLLWVFGLCASGAWSATRGMDGMVFQVWTLVFGLTFLIMICTGEVQTAFRRWKKLKLLLDYLNRSFICSQFSGTILRFDLDSMAIWQVGSKDRNHLLQSHSIDLMEDNAQRREGKVALEQWLKEDASGAWVKAITAQNLSKLLNGPMLDHADVLCDPAPTGAGLIDGLTALAEESFKPATHMHLSDTGVVRVVRAVWDHPGLQQQQPSPPESPAVRLATWQRHARYITLRYVALTRYALQQIRNGLSHVLWAALAVILCVSSYPFQGGHALGGLTSIACLGLLASIAFLLLQFERHPLLSRLQGKDAGKTNFLHLAGQLLSIGGLPLIALLASQFPALGDFLFSWVRPALEAAH